jgi:hypothetical protein
MLTPEENVLDLRKKTSPEIYGRECAGCKCDFDWIHYRKDSSQRDGYAPLCYSCENSPKLSTREHVSRVRERNFNAASSQRARFQDDYKNDEARIGRQMHHSALIEVLRKLVPSLYITEGRIEGDLAVFLTYPCPQPELDGRDFRYLFYIPTGLLPEYSLWEFDKIKDIRIRESRRGWRTPLLRLIKTGLLTEEACNKVFGVPTGEASTVWHRELFEFRNQMLAEK